MTDDSWFDWSETRASYRPDPTPDDYAEPAPKGCWKGEHRAIRNHDCVRYSIHCPGEICRGEFYRRTAVLVRPEGTCRRGTVRVTKACLACADMK